MNLRKLMWLLLLASLWGPSFLFIKVAVDEIPTFTFVFARAALAAMILYLILHVQGRSLPKLGPMWKHFAFLGFVHNALPFALFAWGELYINSASAAILNGTTPLFTIILAHIFVEDDRLTPTKLVGTLIGFSGLLLLIMPSLIDHGMQGTTLGLLAVAVASACYGVAIVYSRKYTRGLPPLVAPTAQLTMASLYLLPLVLFIELPNGLAVPSATAIAATLVLSIFGTAIAFVVYYKALETINPSSLSMVTYLIPIIGTVLGVVVLKEQLTWNIYIGCLLILLGVMTVNGVFNFRSKRASMAAS